MSSEETQPAAAPPPLWLKLGALAGPAAQFGLGAGARPVRSLAQLHWQADRVRAELALLKRELAEAQADLAIAQGARVRLADEQIALAAARAKGIADVAHHSLGALALGAGDPAREEGSARLLALREANEELVHAAAVARVGEAEVHAEHERQITFLAMVAHELRNPLLPLRLAAQMLAQARTDEVKFAGLQATIASQVAQMGRLIGDLLDGSRVSARKFRLERATIDVCDAVRTAIETLQPAMDERRQRLRVDLPDLPQHVHGDSMRLVQVFGNLLENAAKYTPEGGDILLSVAPRGENVAIAIHDNGIGISSEALPHVFELFVQDSHAVAASREGLGIGLAVVRDLVEAHGGSVAASSAGLGHGSEFVVLLPLLRD